MANELFYYEKQNISTKTVVRHGRSQCTPEEMREKLRSISQMVEQLKRQIPIGNQARQWEQQYFYSKKDRYIIMQLRELDETTVKYFIGKSNFA